MKKQKTDRGFALYNFKESNGLPCSLQKSSRADKDEIWLGRHGDEPEKHPVFGVSLGMRMCLDRKLAAKLARKLAAFAETGEI